MLLKVFTVPADGRPPRHADERPSSRLARRMNRPSESGGSGNSGPIHGDTSGHSLTELR